MSASYLLRFDDLCPTMNWDVWDVIESLLVDEGIRPILAVVPDNRDPVLVAGPPNEAFWDRVRRWQARGWTIGMHGFQHVTVTDEAGLIGINRRSEFAGLARDEQERKIRDALAIFRRENVRPEVWLAPNCSFDLTTVDVLRLAGIRIISDGLWLFPCADGEEMLWIPHQIWRFHRMPFGVWTVGCHHNGWTADHVKAFTRDVKAFRDRMTDVAAVAAAYERRRGPSVADRLASKAFLAAIKLKRSAREARVLKVPSDAY